MRPDPEQLSDHLTRAQSVLAFAEASGDESALRLAAMVVSELLAEAEAHGIATGGGLRAARPGAHAKTGGSGS